ncbi:transposase [Neobacillus niacini]|uniref:helix-turn-helix domain-containing protein n=1 Tax=Neobacillus niacini TaxID=86668 RepID=UPI0028631E7C|nr:helix-turn-helix domain-containing protein [Neobacillus niacini]MDR7079546.1 transposase [Neobacillus niacini]
MRKKQASHSGVEVKLDAVRQVLENKRSVAEVASELDLHRDTVNRWVNTFKDNGEKGLVNPRSISQPSQSKDIKRIRELEKELKEKEMESEIPKKFQAFLKGNE